MASKLRAKLKAVRPQPRSGADAAAGAVEHAPPVSQRLSDDAEGKPVGTRIRASAATERQFNVKFKAKRMPLLPGEIESEGRRKQIPDRRHREERELTLGVDFGTSCTKVIISDMAARKSFAVPFHEAKGIDRYLLASRIYEAGGKYSLQGRGKVHRDLKLSFINGEGDKDAERRVVAYLALVIRRARGWLLKEHFDVYRYVRIYWRFALGLPVRQSFDGELKGRFEIVGLASWYLAGSDGDVTRASIDLALAKAAKGYRSQEEVDIRVMPEIAAQIYGFVVSDSFDRKGRNVFLMADVGSGTVDASLFYVKEVKGKKHDFSFYTSTVEPYGVSNLHRHRASWWLTNLRTADAAPSLIREVQESMETTDHDLRIPEDYRSYFDGSVGDSSDASPPDDSFFRRVVKQVVTETFIKAHLDGQVAITQLNGVPFYLCGGGSRMEYYGRLKHELKQIKPEWGKISATATPLVVPGNLEAMGIERDYDRLSVAYGLSWLEAGQVVSTEPMRRLDKPETSGYRSNFVDKDQM